MQYPRLISSIFLTVAGVMVLLLVCHTVVAIDKTTSRKTLLVALTACLFFVQKSGDTFHDYNGVVFAALFSLLISTLVWLRDESNMREKIKFNAISTLLAAIIFSAIQLIATVVEQTILVWRHMSEELMPVTPHVSGILAGMAAFFLMDMYMVKRINSGRLRVSVPDLLLRAIIAGIMATTITYLANLERIDSHLLRSKFGLLFSFVYVLAMTSSSIAWIWIFRTELIGNRFAKAVLVAVVSILCVLAISACHWKVQTLSSNTRLDFVTLCIFIYLLPSITMLAATVAAMKIFGAICDTLYMPVIDPSQEAATRSAD